MCALAESRVTSLIRRGHFPYLQPLFRVLYIAKRSFFSHTGLVSRRLCTARCWAPVCIRVLHLLQVWETAMLLLFPFFHLPPPSPSLHTHSENTRMTCSAPRRIEGGSESSVKGKSVQLYSGGKTALGRTPSGLSLASITMQHTSEAQRAAMQSHYTGTGALTHTH